MAASLLCVAARQEHSNHSIVPITSWNILTISPHTQKKKRGYQISVEAEGKNYSNRALGLYSMYEKTLPTI